MFVQQQYDEKYQSRVEFMRVCASMVCTADASRLTNPLNVVQMYTLHGSPFASKKYVPLYTRASGTDTQKSTAAVHRYGSYLDAVSKLKQHLGR